MYLTSYSIHYMYTLSRAPTRATHNTEYTWRNKLIDLSLIRLEWVSISQNLFPINRPNVYFTQTLFIFRQLKRRAAPTSSRKIQVSLSDLTIFGPPELFRYTWLPSIWLGLLTLGFLQPESTIYSNIWNSQEALLEKLLSKISEHLKLMTSVCWASIAHARTWLYAQLSFQTRHHVHIYFSLSLLHSPFKYDFEKSMTTHYFIHTLPTLASLSCLSHADPNYSYRSKHREMRWKISPSRGYRIANKLYKDVGYASTYATISH